MRPYKITSADDFWYDLTFAGQLIRRVPALEWRSAKQQVNRANDLYEAQCNAITGRAKRFAAATRALRLCGKLTVSRARLTRKTIIAANKARSLNV